MSPMSSDTRKTPEAARPESQPHGTTMDQIAEMESEGQGQDGQAGQRAPERSSGTNREHEKPHPR